MKIITLLFTAILISLIVTTNSAVSQTAANTYGPIKSGDILWNIAAFVRHDQSISRYQTMLALLKANPQAFRTPCNLNTLKVGKTLQVPSRAEMQAMSHVDAVNEFNRQYQEWKTHRRQGQAIVCPQHSVPPLTKPESFQSVSHSASTPIATTLATNLSNARNKVSTPNQESPEQNEAPNPNQETAKSPLTPSTEDNVLSWFSAPLSLSIIVIALLIMVLLFIAFFIGWRLQKYANHQSVTQTNRLPDAPVETPSSANAPKIHKHPNEIVPNNRGYSAISDAPTTMPIETATAFVNQSNGMKEKLENVRACLAEDKVQITDKLLREVIQKGTPEQQEEARQLYEINKKMNYLEQNAGHTPPVSKSTTYPIWQDVEQKGKHLPTQYLPESREKVFELIDKIFELLDYELNAQGKLIDAYVNRHQQEFFHKPYEMVEKPEKVIVDDKKDNLSKPRYEPNPPRHL